jgi:Hsp90 protein
VLYLTEAIDEVVFTNLATYDGKQLMDVSREGLEMDEEEGSKVRLFYIYLISPCNCACADAAQVVPTGSTHTPVGLPMGVQLASFTRGCTADALWHGCVQGLFANCTPLCCLMSRSGH